MKTTDVPAALGGKMPDTKLADHLLAELEDGARALRLVSPPDQERIDRLVRLTVEV